MIQLCLPGRPIEIRQTLGKEDDRLHRPMMRVRYQAMRHGDHFFAMVSRFGVRYGVPSGAPWIHGHVPSPPNCLGGEAVFRERPFAHAALAGGITPVRSLLFRHMFTDCIKRHIVSYGLEVQLARRKASISKPAGTAFSLAYWWDCETLPTFAATFNIESEGHSHWSTRAFLDLWRGHGGNPHARGSRGFERYNKITMRGPRR